MLNKFVDNLIKVQTDVIGDNTIKARLAKLKRGCLQASDVNEIHQHSLDIRMEFDIDIQRGLKTIYDRDDQQLRSLEQVPRSRASIGLRPSDQTKVSC